MADLRKTSRHRTWKPRHSDRCARGCHATLLRAFDQAITQMEEEPEKIRPGWLKPTVEREMGCEIADAYIQCGTVYVVSLGELETVTVNINQIKPTAILIDPIIRNFRRARMN